MFHMFLHVAYATTTKNPRMHAVLSRQQDSTRLPRSSVYTCSP